MKIGVFQFAPIFGQIQKNLDLIEAALRYVNADLMVLPELCTTGYQFLSRQEAENFSESCDGPTVQRLTQLCRDRNMHIAAGFAEKDKDCIYNSAVLTGPKGVTGIYRKTHLFAEEKKWFDPGDTGFRVWDIGPARIGMMICFDWIFPESARALSLQGADIICHPANLVLPYCPDAMVTRSIENRVFTATANRIGQEKRSGDGYSFIGLSQVTSTRGETLFRMEPEEAGCRMVDVKINEARDKQITEHNHLLHDRRPEQYGCKVAK